MSFDADRPNQLRGDTVDEYPGGKKVHDPYRWLEDDLAAAKWVAAQEGRTQEYFRSIAATRDLFKERLAAAYESEKTGCTFPVGRGSQRRYYFYRHEGLRSHACLMSSKEVDGDAHVFFDPNTLSSDGSKALGASAFSPSGKFWAYGVSSSGSEWQIIHIRDVAANEDQETIEWVKFGGISWLPDDSGFVYSRFPASANVSTESEGGHRNCDTNMKIYYHRVGTSQAQDVALFALPDEASRMMQAQVSPDGNYIYITISSPTYTQSMPPTSAEIYIGLFHRVLDAARLSREGGTGGGRAGGEAVMIKLLPHFDAYYEAVACDGSVLYLRTNKDAPLYKLVSVDLTHRLSREAAGGACGAGVREVVAEQKDLLLGVQQVSCKYFVALYMLQGMSQSLPEEQEASLQGDHARCCAPWCKNRRRRRVVDAPRAPLRPQSTETVGTGEMACCHALEILSMAGRRLKRVDLPDFASITEISGSNGGDEEEFFFSVVSHTLPASTWKFDVRTMTSTKLRQQTVIDYSPKDFRTTQVYYRSKDKTRVPMFIICHKEWVPTANTPALLCGYGGFNASNTPKFDLSRILFIKHFCGIVCVANIRGGGEFGARWHQLGCNNYGISGQLHKQTSVDDFIAAAQFLIAQRYTCSSKLAIAGSSNGGLLVAACANQRPELFRCVVPQAGVMDMLRYHRFTTAHAWRSEYGCADASEEEFKALYALSPLHNIHYHNQHPAVLVMTGENDERVLPLHSFKYTAQLQHALETARSNRPLLIRVQPKSGHGAGKPTEVMLAEAADFFAFIAHQTNSPFHEPRDSDAERDRRPSFFDERMQQNKRQE